MNGNTVFFLLSMMFGAVQEVKCKTAIYNTYRCCVCGSALSFNEIFFTSDMQSKKRFLCQKCQRIIRGKEEESLAQALKIQFEGHEASTSFIDEVVEADCFYEHSGVRQLIDEAIWEFSPADVQNPRKIKVGKHKKNMVLKKKKLQKKKSLEDDSDVTVHLSTPVSPLQKMWMYALPHSELGSHLQLQVVHGDTLFTAFSTIPAHELWCQGARCVVVTEDGYTFFDIEKNQRFFFSQKQDIDEHLAIQGFRPDFKVFIQDEHPIMHLSEQDSLNVLTHFETNISEAFEKYQQDTKKNDEKYNIQVDSILKQFSKL